MPEETINRLDRIRQVVEEEDGPGLGLLDRDSCLALLVVVDAAQATDPYCVNFPSDSYINCYEIDAKSKPWLTFPCLHCALTSLISRSGQGDS